jgi:hypothetical protein
MVENIGVNGSDMDDIYDTNSYNYFPLKYGVRSYE